MTRRLLLLSAAGTLAACAGLLTRPTPPRVVLTDLRLGEATLLAQHYALTLEIQNPNPFELVVEGMDCEVLLNGELFASGVSGRPATIPPYGTGSLEVSVTGTLLGVVRQLTGLERTGTETFRWQLRGHVGLRGAGRLPFDSSGEISLGPRGPGRTP